VIIGGAPAAWRDSVAKELHRPSGAYYFVRWSGLLSDTGHVGQLGHSRRYFAVQSIDEMRLPRPGDCRLPAALRVKPDSERPRRG
jgi:hypothetical protein